MNKKEKFMNLAIEEAKKGIGFVNPDPLQGVIIVKDEKVIGRGSYLKYGDMSPIDKAVKEAEGNIFGSELYTNIEPLDSVEKIVSSGVKTIYIGILNPKSDGSSIKRLKQAGIEVVLGVLSEETEELNEISIHYIKTGSPFVFVKWAMTLDGKLATRTGDSKWISGEDSLRFVHILRQRVSAIMVGENTVRLDNPMLTTRLEGVNISNPIRVILSKYGDIQSDANVLKVDEHTKTIIIASNKISQTVEKELLSKGVSVIKLQEVNGRIPFKSIVEALGERGIDSLYIEGGSEVLASAFESRVINKVYAAVAPKIVGGRNAVTPVGGEGIEKMRDAIVLKKVRHEIVGDDVIIKGYLE